MYDSPVNSPTKQTPIANLSEQCGGNLKALHQAITELELRLEMIAQPAPPQNAPGPAPATTPPPNASSHVMFLGTTVLGISDATVRLNRLMARLEL